MLYLIKYLQQSDGETHTRMVKADNRAPAVSAFMDEFFGNNPGDALKLLDVAEIEMTGDLQYAEELERGALISPYGGAR